MRFQEDQLRGMSPIHSPRGSKTDQTRHWNAVTWEVAKVIKKKDNTVIWNSGFSPVSRNRKDDMFMEQTDLRIRCWGHSFPLGSGWGLGVFSERLDSWGKARCGCMGMWPFEKDTGHSESLTVRLPEQMPLSPSHEMPRLSLSGRDLSLWSTEMCLSRERRSFSFLT